MSGARASTEGHDEPRHYEIRLKGHLDSRWTVWFDGLILTRESNGTTLLSGRVTDQAALYGLLRKVRDLGLPLISVIRVEPEQTESNQPDVPTVEPR